MDDILFYQQVSALKHQTADNKMNICKFKEKCIIQAISYWEFKD